MSPYLYTGPLCRYYAGDFPGAPGPVTLPAHIRQQTKALPRPDDLLQPLETWRGLLAENLRPYLGLPLHWEEEPEGEARGWRLPTAAWRALLLWAAHDDVPQWGVPTELPEDHREDPAFREASDIERETAYPHLLRETDFWLPYRGPITFRGQDIYARQRAFGSCYLLLRELVHLNARTWAADGPTLRAWGTPPKPGTGLEPTARWAFGRLYAAAEQAALNNVPLVREG